MQKFWQSLSFFKQYLGQPGMVGSMLPSSPFLCRALVKPLSHIQGNYVREAPLRVLEVGPGTGVVTACILENLKAGDTLCMVEANPQFVDLLQLKLKEWAIKYPGISISCHAGYIEEQKFEAPFDYVISGLPLNSFPEVSVRKVLDCYRVFLRPGGTLSYFEYLGVRRVKHTISLLTGKHERVRVSKMLADFVSSYAKGYEIVLLNYPPAVARHFDLHQENY